MKRRARSWRPASRIRRAVWRPHGGTGAGNSEPGGWPWHGLQQQSAIARTDLVLPFSQDLTAHRLDDEGLDSTALTRAVTKWNTQVRNVERIPELARWALREALTGRPGPVHLDLPSDVLAAEYDFPQDEIEAPPGALSSDRQGPCIGHPGAQGGRDAAGREAAVAAGRGRHHPFARGAPVPRLRSRLGAAATCTQMAIGSIPTDSPWFIGHGGALRG